MQTDERNTVHGTYGCVWNAWINICYATEMLLFQRESDDSQTVLFWCPLISSEARWCTAASPVPTPQSWFSSPPLRRPSPPEIIGKSDHSMKHSVGSWWFLMINDCLWLFNQHHYFLFHSWGSDPRIITFSVSSFGFSAVPLTVTLPALHEINRKNPNHQPKWQGS